MLFTAQHGINFLSHRLIHPNQWQQEKRVRLVQRPLGTFWQTTPRVLTDALAAGGAEAKRAFAAMMDMGKIDITKVESARRGWGFLRSAVILKQLLDFPHRVVMEKVRH